MCEVCFELSDIYFQFVKDKFIGYFLVKMFWIKKKKLNGYWVGYGYPWVINLDRCLEWILMGIAMGISDLHPIQGHS